jgi:uncharacterized protein involved in cysteine biosynthesis
MGIGLIFKSFGKTLGQITDPRFSRVLLLGLALTLALLVGAYALVLWLVQMLVGDTLTLPWIGTISGLDTLLGWSSLLLMMVLSVFLMVPVASAITSMFLDTVADAVEQRHYPGLPPATPLPMGEAVKDTINFLGLLVAANVLALVVYLFVFWIPFAPALVFWGLNGVLLGREYFTLAAARRLGRDGARQLRKRYRGTIWLAGFLMAIPLSVPLMNLVIPILGAATFTHIFHGLRKTGG